MPEKTELEKKYEQVKSLLITILASINDAATEVTFEETDAGKTYSFDFRYTPMIELTDEDRETIAMLEDDEAGYDLVGLTEMIDNAEDTTVYM